MKGTLFYGVLAQGPEGGDASIEIDELVPSEHVERAFEEAAPSASPPSSSDAATN